MADKRVSRNDVARLAGVSEATVSFVFSKKRHVSDELIERVLAVSKELDYQPDFIARSMVTKRTDTIAVLTNDIASPLQMEVIKSIEEEAMKKGFFVNVCGGTENLERYIDNFIARRVDGVFLSVVLSYVSDSYIEKMLNKGVSVIVNSARHIEDDRICGLELDFVYGVKKIVEYLKSIGHRDIAFLSCFDEKYSADKRLRAFKEAMKEEFGEENPLIIKGNQPYESTITTGYNELMELLALKKSFTAVVCTNDLMAMGAVDALRENGFEIPKDVSVVGIDDILFAKAFFPPLTTLSHEAKEYGKKIFEILYENIKDKNKVGREVVLPKLVVRKSTDKPKILNNIRN